MFNYKLDYYDGINILQTESEVEMDNYIAKLGKITKIHRNKYIANRFEIAFSTIMGVYSLIITPNTPLTIISEYRDKHRLDLASIISITADIVDGIVVGKDDDIGPLKDVESQILKILNK